ncbi:hypothetical protein Hs30E_10850 [Lactococcus hodotermopsidis]|uniref:Uncharacterized protein n=1 Tax=Pseudolactococcus hodotermopsidis TaxID=2709157 RepID=A0A6A0BDI6_9LACT|nr:hypothetical protein [Lactococcus hodotermopsidis]GFH42534.1 hypothetical protein Hs30E_10850 [Lactococcus hodotermopsidis]
MRWVDFKFENTDNYPQYVWRYPSGQNEKATLLACDRQTGGTLATYQLERFR